MSSFILDSPSIDSFLPIVPVFGDSIDVKVFNVKINVDNKLRTECYHENFSADF